MNSRTQLEAELEERLERRAAQVHVKAPPRLDGALHRRARARRVRTLSAGLATASLAGVMTIAAFGILRGATTVVVTTVMPAAALPETIATLSAAARVSSPSTATAGGAPTLAPVESVAPVAVDPAPATTVTVPPGPSASPLPRFALQGDDAPLEYVSTDGAGLGTATGVQLQVYRVAGGYSPPVVTVEIIPAGAEFGLGDGAPADIMDEVYVHGLTAYLVDDPALVTSSIGWRQGDGTGIFLQGVGIGGHELHEIAQNLLPDVTGTLRPTSLPYGLETQPAYEGPLGVYGASYTMTYSAPAVEISVRDGGAGAFESLALESAASAEAVEVITTHGGPAVLFDYGAEEDFGVIWTARGDTVAVGVWLGVSREAVPEVLDALVEVDEATWQAGVAAMLAANAGVETTVAYFSEG